VTEYREGWLDAAEAVSSPYPESVFTPLEPAEVASIVAAMNTVVPNGSERMHAAWARHWGDVLRRQVQA